MKKIFNCFFLWDITNEIIILKHWTAAYLVTVILLTIYSGNEGLMISIGTGLALLYSYRMIHLKNEIFMTIRQKYRMRLKYIYLMASLVWLLSFAINVLLKLIFPVDFYQLLDLQFHWCFSLCLLFMQLPMVFIRKKATWWCCWTAGMALLILFHYGVYGLIKEPETRLAFGIGAAVIICAGGYFLCGILITKGQNQRKQQLTRLIERS